MAAYDNKKHAHCMPDKEATRAEEQAHAFAHPSTRTQARTHARARARLHAEKCNTRTYCFATTTMIL